MDKRELIKELKRLRADVEEMQTLLMKHGISYTPHSAPASKQQNSQITTTQDSAPGTPTAHPKSIVIAEKEEQHQRNATDGSPFVQRQDSSGSPSLSSAAPVTPTNGTTQDNTNANQNMLNVIVEQRDETKEQKTI